MENVNGVLGQFRKLATVGGAVDNSAIISKYVDSFRFAFTFVCVCVCVSLLMPCDYQSNGRQQYLITTSCTQFEFLSYNFILCLFCMFCFVFFVFSDFWFAGQLGVGKSLRRLGVRRLRQSQETPTSAKWAANPSPVREIDGDREGERERDLWTFYGPRQDWLTELEFPSLNLLSRCEMKSKPLEFRETVNLSFSLSLSLLAVSLSLFFFLSHKLWLKYYRACSSLIF